MSIPGPGEYKYKNFSTGTGGRHFSFLKRTRNSQGKCDFELFRKTRFEIALSYFILKPTLLRSLSEIDMIAVVTHFCP